MGSHPLDIPRALVRSHEFWLCGSAWFINSVRWYLRDHQAKEACYVPHASLVQLPTNRFAAQLAVSTDHHMGAAGVGVARLCCSSNVLTFTASTYASEIVAGAPGRGSSLSPSSRLRAKRCRHLPAVTGWHPSAAALSIFICWPPPRAGSPSGRPAPAPCTDAAPNAQVSRAPLLPTRSSLSDGPVGCPRHSTTARKHLKQPSQHHTFAPSLSGSGR